MIRVIVGCVTVLIFFSSFKEDPSSRYISEFKEVAIAEMHRTGIPASIKMAQALLESGAGRSSLANEANNHFGIKCGGSWTGGTYYLHDDDYNSRGKLIKSCFRQFDSAMESFMAHSDFLTKQNRYAFLFQLNPKDYESWARGLKKAGYATDKAYADKLINIIEKYQLYLLDDEMLDSFDGMLADAGPAQRPQRTTTGSQDGLFTYPAASTDATSSGSGLEKSSQHSSRRAAREDALYHIVGFEESIEDIARMYDIDEKSIRLRNRIPRDGQAEPGEKLYLRKKIRIGSRPEYSRDNDGNSIASADSFIF